MGVEKITRNTLDYDFVEATWGRSPAFGYFPTDDRLAASYSLRYANEVIGTGWSAGLTGLFALEHLSEAMEGLSDADFAQLLEGLGKTIPQPAVGTGAARLGLSLDPEDGDFSPHIGFGRLRYRWGVGAGFGIYNLNGGELVSRTALYATAITAVVYMGAAASRYGDGGKAVADTAGYLFDIIAPFNAIRETVNFVDYAARRPKPADPIETIPELERFLSYLQSFQKKGLTFTALVKIDDALAASDNLYVRARLRQFKDLFLIQSKRTFFPYIVSGRHPEVIQDPAEIVRINTNAAIDRARGFRDKYKDWLVGGTSEGISVPGADEIGRYMEDTLYLSSKLPMIVETEKEEGKNVHTIVENSAFCLDDAGRMMVFLEEVASVYKYMNNPSSGLRRFVAGDIGAKRGLPVDLQLLVSWIEELGNNAAHFEMRQKHILWKIAGEEPSDGREEMFTKAKRTHVNTELIDASLSSLTAAHSRLLTFYEGLEYITGLANTDPEETGRPIVESIRRGNDLAAALDRPTLEEGFYYLHQMLKFEEVLSGDEKRMARSIIREAKELLKKAVKERESSVSWLIVGHHNIQEGDKEGFRSLTNESLGLLDDTIKGVKNLEDHLKKMGAETSNLTGLIRERIRALKMALVRLDRSITSDFNLNILPGSTRDIFEEERLEAGVIRQHMAGIRGLLYGGTGIVPLLKRIKAMTNPRLNPGRKDEMKVIVEVIDGMIEEFEGYARTGIKAMDTLERMQQRRAGRATMRIYATHWGAEIMPWAE